ncbi:hypothetical protein BKA70DRAFT_99679 [Coprinopsis sp. MPI-PUGE-AT-0042]|nr:hypothetical protein BKA70DRAFT_99679 [Coprinopsis sp. MPI-PUGE-AT-0042]
MTSPILVKGRVANGLPPPFPPPTPPKALSIYRNLGFLLLRASPARLRGVYLAGHRDDYEDDGRDEWRGRNRQNVPRSRSSTTTMTNEAGVGLIPSQRIDPHLQRYIPPSSSAVSKSDNVFLTHHIPTALKALESIPKQVQEERLHRCTTGNQSQPLVESSDSGATKEHQRPNTLHSAGSGGPLLPPTSHGVPTMTCLMRFLVSLRPRSTTHSSRGAGPVTRQREG